MAQTIDIQEILAQIAKLGKAEQITLLQKLVLIVRKTKSETHQTKLSAISGVGADIWKGTDINQYVQSEREW